MPTCLKSELKLVTTKLKHSGTRTLLNNIILLLYSKERHADSARDTVHKATLERRTTTTDVVRSRYSYVRAHQRNHKEMCNKETSIDKK